MKARPSLRDPKALFSLGVPVLLLTGCSGPDLTLAARQSVRWAERVDDAAALSVLFYAGSTHGDTSEAMIDLATPAITSALTPSCVPAPKVESSRATFTFKGCKGEDGSHGVRDLDGTVVAEYAINDATGDMLGVTLSTQGLTLDGRSGDLSLALGNIFPATTWTSTPENEFAFHLADRSPPASNNENRDALLAFTGDYQVPMGCDAGTKSPPRIGVANGLVSVDDGAAWTISASGFERCGDRCPRAGTITAQLEIAVKVELDGSATARVTDLGSGETAQVALDCTP